MSKAPLLRNGGELLEKKWYHVETETLLWFTDPHNGLEGFSKSLADTPENLTCRPPAGVFSQVTLVSVFWPYATGYLYMSPENGQSNSWYSAWRAAYVAGTVMKSGHQAWHLSWLSGLDACEQRKFKKS